MLGVKRPGATGIARGMAQEATTPMQHKQYPAVPDDFGHWLAGFIDGEGCFGITRKPHIDSRITYACLLGISLRDDDADILHEIQARTGCGNLTFRPRRRTGGRNFDTKPGVHWNVHNRHDCMRIDELLTRFPLRAKKARDFAIWHEALRVWAQTVRGFSARGGVNVARWRRMAELKETLTRTRAYQGSVLVPEVGQMNAVTAGDNMTLL